MTTRSTEASHSRPVQTRLSSGEANANALEELREVNRRLGELTALVERAAHDADALRRQTTTWRIARAVFWGVVLVILLPILIWVIALAISGGAINWG